MIQFTIGPESAVSIIVTIIGGAYWIVQSQSKMRESLAVLANNLDRAEKGAEKNDQRYERHDQRIRDLERVLGRSANLRELED